MRCFLVRLAGEEHTGRTALPRRNAAATSVVQSTRAGSVSLFLLHYLLIEHEMPATIHLMDSLRGAKGKTGKWEPRWWCPQWPRRREPLAVAGDATSGATR